MMIPALLDKMAAVIRRDLLTAIRYRSGFFLMAGSTITQIATFYFLARAIGPGFHPQGMGYFPFVLVGTGVYTFLIMSINSFLGIVRDAQQNGTLEVLMTSATPAPVLILLSAISAFAGATLQLLLYLGAGTLLFASMPSHPNLLAAIVVFGFTLGNAIAFGMLAAAIQLATQKGSAAVWLFASVTWCLAGTLFPVTSLPRGLRWLAELIPFTHSLAGLRLSLLGGAGFAAISQEIVILALFSLVLVPLSLLLFSHALRNARLRGTLSFY
ncbi:MAG: ABC transporter permease [Acidobacteriales bacterium]|nr:ABC transporter permease [Terriglobales bacterium]